MDIKAVLTSHGVTMKQVAEQLNISQQAVSQAINGNPSLSRLQEIARVVGIPLSELVADNPSQPVEPLMRCPHCGAEIKIELK